MDLCKELEGLNKENMENTQIAEPIVNDADNRIEFMISKPQYLVDLHDSLVKFLDDIIYHSDPPSVAQRTRHSKVSSSAVGVYKYGKEFYIQTQAFEDEVAEDEKRVRRGEPPDLAYSRVPPDKSKHSIPESTLRLTDPKCAAVKQLCDNISREPMIEGRELYLVQCVHYCGEQDRGRHIDNKLNAGDIIVGCTFGSEQEGEERTMSLDRNGKRKREFTLPPGSVYAMKGACRHEWYHCAKKQKNTTPYAILLRFGKSA
jgi:2OG-Fe(II) oxygenase superfamily